MWRPLLECFWTRLQVSAKGKASGIPTGSISIREGRRLHYTGYKDLECGFWARCLQACSFGSQAAIGSLHLAQSTTEHVGSSVSLWPPRVALAVYDFLTDLTHVLAGPHIPPHSLVGEISCLQPLSTSEAPLLGFAEYPFPSHWSDQGLSLSTPVQTFGRSHSPCAGQITF